MPSHLGVEERACKKVMEMLQVTVCLPIFPPAGTGTRTDSRGLIDGGSSLCSERVSIGRRMYEKGKWPRPVWREPESWGAERELLPTSRTQEESYLLPRPTQSKQGGEVNFRSPFKGPFLLTVSQISMKMAGKSVCEIHEECLPGAKGLHFRS